MGLCLSAIPQVDTDEMRIPDFSSFPPWLVLWPALWMDHLCNPLGCRYSWRSYVPFGMSDPGAWFSEEYEIHGVTNLLPVPLSFEKFQEMKGYDVTPGTGLLAGLGSSDGASDWFKSLYEYAFETPSTSLSVLTTPMSLGVIFLLVLCIKAFKAIVMPLFESIGRNLAGKAHGEDWLDKNQERITKFGEYVYRLCYHSFISLVGFYLFWNAPWVSEDQGGTRNFFVDWGADPIKPSMTWYYLMQASYNVDAMISLLQISFQVNLFSKDSSLPVSIGWASTVRGDFNEMLAHHIVTNLLVFMSSYLAMCRIGSMVFWMHDISDVPVDLAKLANFVKWTAGTVVFFVLLCVVWAYTRLYILPFTILSSILLHSQEAGRGLGDIWVYFYAYQPVFVTLLGLLIMLHFIWFNMFIKMGVVLVTKGETHDLSEHKNGEKEGNSVKTNGKTKVN